MVEMRDKKVIRMVVCWACWKDYQSAQLLAFVKVVCLDNSRDPHLVEYSVASMVVEMVDWLVDN